MIVRSSFKCLTCEHPHLVRIGVGYESRHVHRFPCAQCGEDIVIAMNADQEGGTYAYPEAIENAEETAEVAGASVVNVHANFVIPQNERDIDGAFPHMKQMQEMAHTAESRGSAFALTSLDAARINTRPYRAPDFGAEWQLLKKAWRLHRNDKDKLSRRSIENASARFHGSDPLNGLDDWIWRFVMMLGQPAYEPIFSNAFKQLDPLAKESRFVDLVEYYRAEMAPLRGERYFERMKAFFATWSEFSQVYFHVVSSIEIGADHVTSSSDFDAVRMFYGDTFEAFASSVDLLAYINNITCGRPFDTFAQLTKHAYLQLDKAGRKNAFSMNGPFSAICAEWDNQIRNASHHGSFSLDSKSQIISYRAGKGGTGPEQQLPYTQYLVRATRIFLQLMVIFRIEIMICHLTKSKMPF